MKFADFVKDKMLLLLLHMACMLLSVSFLRMTGYPGSYACMILICWLLVLLVWFMSEYFHRKRFFGQALQILEQADPKYLLGELMPRSYRLEDALYRTMILKSNKSVIERIHQIEQQQKDYREYIESWVHEIKAPITSVYLICENHKDALTRRISRQMGRVENYVDMALYYARSDEVYKDYMIKETLLQKTAQEAVIRNKYDLLQGGMQAEVCCKDAVYTDVKWISFILNQLVLNAVKYRSSENPRIWIYTEKDSRGVRLIVRDNGIGIRREELDRIFDKGFTGSNGRKYGQSTGMGLYLCQKLCRKLGIRIYARQAEDPAGNGRINGMEQETGTMVVLEFPVSSYILSRQQERT